MSLTKNLPNKQPTKPKPVKRRTHAQAITELSTLPRYQGTTVPTALNMRPVRSSIAAMPAGLLEKRTELDHLDPRFKDLSLPFYWNDTYKEHGQMPDDLYAEWLFTLEQLMVRGVKCTDIRRLTNGRILLRDLQPLEKVIRETWALTCTPDKRNELRGELFRRSEALEDDLLRRLATIEPDENYAAASSVAKAITGTQARRASLIGADAPKQDAASISVTVATQINPVQQVKESMGIDLDGVDWDAMGDTASELITEVIYTERDADSDDDD